MKMTEYIWSKRSERSFYFVSILTKKAQIM